MEAKDLRIGNYAQQFLGVGDDGPEYKIIVIEAADINRISGLQHHDIEPIDLTEDWLLKLGFAKDSEYIIGVGICWYFKHPKHGYKLSEKFRLMLLGIDINFVHQLQNLFFALTGEELTIK